MSNGPKLALNITYIEIYETKQRYIIFLLLVVVVIVNKVINN